MEPVEPDLSGLIRAYFDTAGIEAAIEGDAVNTPHGRYGLLNLAQTLGRLPRTRWAHHVRQHFDMLRGIRPSFPTAYGDARPRLRIRLTAHPPPGSTVSRPLTTGLHEMLMLRIPEGGISVPARVIAAWEAEADTVWSDARSHTIWDEPHVRSTLRSPGGHEFSRIGGSFWSSSLLVDLCQLGSIGRLGALAVVPCHDLLLYRPLDDAEVWPDLLRLAPLLYGLGPGSITPDVFWWHDGQLERVVRFDHRGPAPVWSNRFRNALDRLQPPTA